MDGQYMEDYNPGHNILALFNNLAQVCMTTSKAILDIQHNKLGTRAASRVAEHLRLRILGYQEILEKCQMWLEMQSSAQSSFQKLSVDNSCQKTRKIRYYGFQVMPNFTVFLYFVPNILSRIVVFLNFQTRILNHGKYRNINNVSTSLCLRA